MTVIDQNTTWAKVEERLATEEILRCEGTSNCCSSI